MNFFNVFISGGLLVFVLTWFYQQYQNWKIRKAFLNLLIAEIFINMYAFKSNIDRFNKMLTGEPYKKIKYLFSFDAWEVVKGSGKSDIFSAEELNFFVSKYSLISKCNQGLMEWSEAPQDEKLDRDNLKEIKNKFSRHLADLKDSDFLKRHTSAMNQARKNILAEALRREGMSNEEIQAHLWQFGKLREAQDQSE